MVMSIPQVTVDLAVLTSIPFSIISIWAVYYFSYAHPRKRERREYALKLEKIYRGIEQSGYKIFAEKFYFISAYAELAREISTKKLLPNNSLRTLTEDSQKLATLAHSNEIKDSLKTRSVSLYLARLKPIVDELKK